MANNNQTLIPPPPPYTPSLAQLAQIAQLTGGAPQDAGSIISAPALPNFMQGVSQPGQPITPINGPIGPQEQTIDSAQNPSTIHQLQMAQQQRQSQLDAEVAAAKKDFEGFKAKAPATVQGAPLTETQKLLNDYMQKQMLANMKPSPLERFNRGYDIGQKIAGNLATIIGAHSHKMGALMGLNQATQNMQRQSSQASAAQAAEREARNNAMARLSELWERMSPESKTNQTKLAAAQLKQNEDYRKQLEDKQKGYIELLGKSTTAGANLLEKANLDANREADNARADKQLKITQDNYADEKANRDRTRAQEDERIKISKQDQLDKYSKANADKYDKDEAAKAKAGEDADKDRAAANKDFLALHDKFVKELSGVGANGQPKYPNAKSYFEDNPAHREALGQLMKRAGLQTSPEQYIDSLIKKSQTPAQPQGGGGNPLQEFITGAKGVLGIKDQGAAPAKQLLPEAKSAAASPPPKVVEAHDALFKKLGRQPTAKELADYVYGK